jgi:hypothetical protein
MCAGSRLHPFSRGVLYFPSPYFHVPLNDSMAPALWRSIPEEGRDSTRKVLRLAFTFDQHHLNLVAGAVAKRLGGCFLLDSEV